MKKAGILMPLFSLPSKSGVGELGEEAYRFVRILSENGIRIWQILPLNPAGFGNSPYQPFSSFAGDEIYISLPLLYGAGLIKAPLPTFNEKADRVDYEAVRKFKEPYLREAYRAFLRGSGQEEPEYKNFISQKWVRDYALFRALKKENGGICWNEWKEDADLQASGARVRGESNFQMFLQFIFYTQWMNLKNNANSLGIEIMGDVPFYVGTDSADVFFDRDDFLLDKEGRPLFIAGVPPDYFCGTGQRWGNPIYDWEHMKKTGYKFWVDRIEYNSRLFDILRIDHFRAFDTFWKIPASCPTAEEGEWTEAPGYEVLDTLYEKIDGLNLVAEDLGELRREVYILRDHYHLKGMKVFVFCLDTSGKRARDTCRDAENMVVYSGTHDNDTLMEWYASLSAAAKRKARRFLKVNGCGQGTVKERLLKYIFASKAECAIVPMADILGLGKEGHINTPGTVGSPNWQWRMSGFEEAEAELKKFKKLVYKV